MNKKIIASCLSIVGLPGIRAGATKLLTMDVCLDQSAVNAVKGQTDSLMLTVNLKQ